MLKTFINSNTEYILIFLSLIILLLVFIIVRLNNKTNDLNRRIEVLENFEYVLANLTKNHNNNFPDDKISYQDDEQSERIIEREETKDYAGETKLDRLVNEYKDKVIYSKKNK